MPTTTDPTLASGYLLAYCEGFTVDSPDGRLGVVEAVLPGPERPHALAVRTGLFTTRLLLVPLDEVEQVLPDEQRVVLSGPVPKEER